MSHRRALALCCALALLVAAAGWFVARSGKSAPGEPGQVERGGGPEIAALPAERIPLPGGAEPAADPAAGARDAAIPEGAGLEAGPIDEFTADGLREPSADAVARTSLAGRVLDAEGAPVAGARVLASLAATHAGAALDAEANAGRVREGATDGEGRFRLAGVDDLGGAARLAVRARGHAPLDVGPFGLPAGEATDLGDQRLARGAALAGRVLDVEHRPVAAARLEIVRTPVLGPVHKLGGAAAVLLGTSDEDGRFDLPCVEAGVVDLVVRAEGFVEATFALDASEPSPAQADLEFVLERGATILGHVRDFDVVSMGELAVTALPYDGLQLLAESKPPGADGRWLAGVRAAPVDPYGRFLIAGLDPGRTYALRAARAPRAPGPAPLELDSPDRSDAWAPYASAPAGAADVEVVYLSGCRIDFEVVDLTTGAPVERLRVRLTGATSDEFPPEAAEVLGAAVPARHSFPGGRVSLADLRAVGGGDFAAPEAEDGGVFTATLTVESPGYDAKTLANLRLAPGARLDLGPVCLAPLAVLAVRVTDAADGEPLAGAKVELFADHPERVVGRTRSVTESDGKGFARVTSLPTSSSTLRVTRPGYAPARVLAPAGARAGQAPMEVGLLREARVFALVRDARGAPAGAVDVVLERHEVQDRLAWRRTACTDAAGRAEFREVPDGVFDASVGGRRGLAAISGAERGSAAARTLVVRTGEETTVEFEVPALAVLSGTLWIGREPLAHARLSIRPGPGGFRDLATDMSRFDLVRPCWTDAQGDFGVELLPGLYSLLIEEAERRVRTLRVVRVEPAGTSVILDVDDTAISGRVVDARGAPVLEALVQVFVDRAGPRQDIRPVPGEFLVPYEDYRRPIASATTDAEGRYRVACVPPGVRLELCFSSGRRTAARPRVNAPEGRTLEHVDALLPDAGALEIRLAAPLPPTGQVYGVRVVGLDQPEGFALFGASFSEEGRASFDDLPPGRWFVMVCAVDAGWAIVERREPQVVLVKAGETTEFSVGW